MTARRKSAPVEVTEPEAPVEVPEQPEDTSEVVKQPGEPVEVGEFPAAPVVDAEHVKQLVALFVDQQMADIKQELADIRMMLMQPKGAVEIEQATVYRDFPHQGDREVPWYTPNY